MLSRGVTKTLDVLGVIGVVGLDNLWASKEDGGLLFDLLFEPSLAEVRSVCTDVSFFVCLIIMAMTFDVMGETLR